MDPPAQTYVILGTVHHPVKVPFAATRKPFRTPLGLAGIDDTFLESLAGRCTTFDLFGDEFAHATEHSIELQVLYLQGVLEERTDAWGIVPILVGSFEEDVRAGRSPIERPEVAEFLAALETVIKEHPRRVCLIGGVDFSHVGPRFGGTAPLTDADLEQVARQDQAMLGAVEAADAEVFLRGFFPDGNARNVCSVAPIYCLLHLMNGTSEGKTLRYGQAVDGDRGGAVSFGSVVFTSKTT
jgi:AmmeMemoRadiSam system protein B